MSATASSSSRWFISALRVASRPSVRAVFVVMAVIMLAMTVGTRTVAAHLPAADQRTLGRT